MLQLCRAEILNTEWYAANLINDPDYTPKPITEIFTTDITFIPKNPSIPTKITSTEPPPATMTIPPTFSTTTEARETVTQNIATVRVPQIIDTAIQQPQGNFQPNNNMPSVVLVYDSNLQTGQIYQQPTSTPAPSTPSPTPPTSSPPSPSPVPRVTPVPTQAELSTSFVTQTSSIPSSSPVVPTLTQAAQRPAIVFEQPPNQNTNLPFIPIGLIPNTLNGNTVIPMSNIPVINSSSAILPPTPVTPNQQNDTVRPENRRPALTVRLKSARGAITNIRINPTTTVRPVTTRRRNAGRRANNYEICLNSCNGRKEPICSSPMGVFPIDPDRLKGFASLCHMACHNSFRKDRKYEAVIYFSY